MYSYCITLVFIGLLSSTLAANCCTYSLFAPCVVSKYTKKYINYDTLLDTDGPASKLAVTEFDAFPSPVPVGGYCLHPHKYSTKYVISLLASCRQPSSFSSSLHMSVCQYWFHFHQAYDMGSSKVTLSVYYTDNPDVTGLDAVVEVTGLNLCNLSTSITCPFTAGTHIF